MELNVYVDRWLKGDFDMAVAENGGRADPYTMYVRYWTKTGNLLKVSNYVDDTLDSLMQQGRAETDPAKRKAIFADFEKHIAEVSPWIWLYTANGYTAAQKNIEGFVPTPIGSLFGLAKVSIKS
jgi:peptide/nickel transport system substrate-binding protein